MKTLRNYDITTALASGPATVADLAMRLAPTTRGAEASVSAILADLERRGKVERAPAQRDGSGRIRVAYRLAGAVEPERQGGLL